MKVSAWRDACLRFGRELPRVVSGLHRQQVLRVRLRLDFDTGALAGVFSGGPTAVSQCAVKGGATTHSTLPHDRIGSLESETALYSTTCRSESHRSYPPWWSSPRAVPPRSH